jgi:hypothetical protein
MRLLRILAPVTCVLAALVLNPAPFAAFTAGAERSLHRHLGEENVICRLYLDPHDKFTRVVPEPRASLTTTGAVEADAVLSNITVNYTGFTGANGPAAQAAFQAAVDIWKTQVASAVPIVVNAAFEDLGGSSGGGTVLGHAGSAATRDFTGAIRAATWFPFPLANKLFGSDLGAGFSDPTISHIDSAFNNNAAVNWYFGTDGIVPAGKVDFESVVLHELGHGLGFFGSVNVSAGSGTIGSGGFPYIYDTFAVDAVTAGNSLINTTAYPNPGTALGTALTGQSEYWDGANGKSANAGARPRLYAPATFAQGSSHSHLNEATYLAGNINSLMTPSIGSAEAIHTPGPIVLGIFADMGWGSNTGGSCSFGLDRTTATVAAAGGTVPVTLSTGTGCNWTATTAASFVTIAPAASGSGSQAFTLTVAANGSVSARTATVTIGGQTLQINQNGSGPTMTLDKTSLIFAAVTNGAAFTGQTPSQTVRMVQSGTGTVSWTASSNVPWLVVSPASGSGSATFTISVQFASNLAATQAGSITLTLTGAGNSAGPIAVTLNTLIASAAAAPVGSFDTPADQSTGVTGSIAVTGWSMDDVGVTSVKIWRNPVSGEGAALVFIGDAVIVDGARPDVAALFPNSPQNTRAGWGYLMLTNFLPGLGNGTFTLHAIATDADGHSTTLGSKTITCTNASATAPFGAIDTPAQGGTVSGSSLNFGWVLGPAPRRADPPGGGTVRIAIDGALIATVPGSWGSRPDLTALFPAAQFPGIATALGVASLNTTALTNGVHTIAWIVTDNQGSASGVGSRYFTVSNSSLHLDPDDVATTGANVIVNSAALAMPRAAALRGGSPRALADEIAAAAADPRPIAGRRGYDAATPFRRYGVAGGPITVQAEELDRVELRLGGGQGLTGYMRTGNSLAPLPIGSALTASTGVFTWQPGVGFVGPYDLVFVRWAGGRALSRQDVRVVLNAKGSNRVGPQVVIDLPAADGRDVTAKSFVVAGWAADLDSTIDGGVDTVHVWAYPVASAQPIFIGAAAFGGARPDVAAVYGERFGRSGYGIEVKGLAPGEYDLAVFAYSTQLGRFAPAKTVRVRVR